MSAFKIWIDRLKGGSPQKIEERVPPAFLGPDEPELRFVRQVMVRGEAYTTDTHLILHLKAMAKVLMPCAVCNKMIEVDLNAEDVYHAEPIGEICGAVFDYSGVLREALLIELPKVVECNRGRCPERTLLAPFMRSASDPAHFPFADMDKEIK